MPKPNKTAPSQVKRRKAVPRGPQPAKAPPDNPTWRQQDHLLSRLAGSDDGAQEVLILDPSPCRFERHTRSLS